MKRLCVILLIGACMLPALPGSAQSGKRSNFQFTFVPPLGTNGRAASEYSNVLSLNLLVGLSQNEEAVAFAGLANLIRNNANGAQFAGLANTANYGRGMQFAGLFNGAVIRYVGAQFAGLVNSVGDMEGAQLAGLANTAHYGRGLQFAGLFNGAATLHKGAQFAGLANSVGNGDMEGVQFAGLANWAGKDRDGVQVAGLANVATDVEGFQLAGLFNVARKVDGVQVAGLLNIAEESDTPIGLINLIRNGKKSAGVTYNEIGSTVATFRSGGKNTYGILGAGYNHKAGSDAYVILAGLGANIRLAPRLSVDNELTFESVGAFTGGDGGTFRTGYTLLPVFGVGNRPGQPPVLELFAGPGIYYLQSERAENIGLFPKHSLWKKHGAGKLQQVHVGYLLGARYAF